MPMCTSCKKCETWNQLSETHGQCRVDAPLANLIPTQGVGGQQLSVVSYWPETKPDDWCGKGIEGVSPAALPKEPSLQPGLLKVN